MSWESPQSLGRHRGQALGRAGALSAAEARGTGPPAAKARGSDARRSGCSACLRHSINCYKFCGASVRPALHVAPAQSLASSWCSGSQAGRQARRKDVKQMWRER